MTANIERSFDLWHQAVSLFPSLISQTLTHDVRAVTQSRHLPFLPLTGPFGPHGLTDEMNKRIFFLFTDLIRDDIIYLTLLTLIVFAAVDPV